MNSLESKHPDPEKECLRLRAIIHNFEELLKVEEEVAASQSAKLKSVADFLSEIYKTMPGALIVLDPNGTITTANEATASMLGYSLEELIGQPIELLFQPKEAPSVAEIKEFSVQDKILRTEKACRTKTDGEIPVLFSATILNAKELDNTAHSAVCIALDIREQKKLESELRQAQKMESVGRLAAGVAHEINTPLQYISDNTLFLQNTFSEMTELIQKLLAVQHSVVEGNPSFQAAVAAANAMEKADLSYLLEDIPKAIRETLDGLGRVTKIVQAMKTFAHPSPAQMTSLDINQAIQSTLTIARSEYKLVADVETDLGELPLVVCHAGDINQVVLNIIVNAAHAIEEVIQSTERKGLITIRTWREENDALISIRDTGRGIPENIREQIFDPFFTTKEVGKGTGQGLSIARSVIVEKHGGKLTFESELNQGTTFLIRLPIGGKR